MGLNISVAMTTYNGAKYLKEQIESILPYLQDEDELIISDDGSSDETKSIITSYAKCNQRVKLIDGPKKGVIRNFENALQNSSKDIIMFSDQDDVWLPEKLPFIRAKFEELPDINLIHHDLYICSNDDIKNHNYVKTLSSGKKWKHGVLRNLAFSVYFGCCTSMRRDFVKQILPFSKYTVAYDQLVGLIAEREHSSLFVYEPLILRREHGDNMTRRRPVPERISFRFKLLASYLDTIMRKD